MTCPLYIVIARKSRPKISPCCSKTMPLPTRSTNLSIKRVPSFSVTITRFPRLALVCVVIIMRQKCHISCVMRRHFRLALLGQQRRNIAVVSKLLLVLVTQRNHRPVLVVRAFVRTPFLALPNNIHFSVPSLKVGAGRSAGSSS